MKKLQLLLALVVCFFSKAQDNPFAEYGYTPKIATLSQGQYNESFDNDTIVQIGSVLFNTISNQIVAFVEYDTLYSEATLEPDVVSRWMSPDPLAAKYPSLSPYNFSNNNPILFSDVDGRYFVAKVITESGEEILVKIGSKKIITSTKANSDLGKIEQMLSHLKSSGNKQAQLIYNVLENSDVEIRIGYDSENPKAFASNTKNPTKDGLDVDVHLSKVAIINDFSSGEDKEIYQSASITFGAHELGHIFGNLITALEENGLDGTGITQEQFNSLLEIDKQIQTMTGEDRGGEEYATQIQNYFASGIENEPLMKSYSGSSETSQRLGDKEVESPTESKKQ